MAANPLHRMTVEEFRALPKAVGDYNYELHHGVLVPVTRPRLKHWDLQDRLSDALKARAQGKGRVGYEVAFRAFPEFDLRVADVAYVSAERWGTRDPEDNLHGAPDLVIEILSPSNSAREMYEKEQLCLSHGSAEFWVIDADARTVRVARRDGPTVMYGSGETVPLPLMSGDLAVDEIFVGC